MDIEYLRRWQWALLGLLIGVALALSKSANRTDFDLHSLDKNFDTIAYGSADYPVATGFIFAGMHWNYLTDVVVHPPVPSDPHVDGSNGLSPGTPIYWVTGLLHEARPSSRKDRSGHWKFEDVTVSQFMHRSSMPYKVNGKIWPDVRAYLAEVARQSNGRGGHFRYAWWETPRAIWMIYPLAGIVVIGGIWPSVISLLRGAGMGRKRVEQAYTLRASWGSTAAGTTKPGIPPEDAAPLPATNASSEQAVREGDYYPTEIHRPSSRTNPKA